MTAMIRTRSMCKAYIFAFSLSLAGASIATASVAAEYRTQPGDTIEINVAGLPEMRERAVIQDDGAISFPLLGELSVTGLTSSELQAKIQAGLTNKIYRRWNAEGREVDIILRPDEISASVVDYRPIYISGDVAKPGAVPFRPLMTVRAAISLAGGYDVMARQGTDLLLQATSLKGDGALSWLDFAKASAHVARITAELAGKSQIAATDTADIPLPKDQLQQIDRLETQSLKTDIVAFQHETASLQSAISQADNQIAIVAKLEKEDADGVQADQQDLQKSIDLYKRGMLTSSRVDDARRAVLFSSTQTLQAMSQLLTLQRTRQEAVEAFEHYSDQRKIALLKELQDATLALNEARLKGINVREKLMAISRSQSEYLDETTLRSTISIIRHGLDGTAKLPANLDTNLEPGDLVQIDKEPGRIGSASIEMDPSPVAPANFLAREAQTR